MKFGYVVADFPKLSETFVAREVINLRKLGFDIEVMAFNGPGSDELPKLSAEMRDLYATVHYISKEQAALSMVPRALLRPDVVAYARKMHAASTLKAQPVLLLGRGLAVARLARRLGVQHLHAHWPYATQVTAIASKASGLPYSISVHAHEVAHEGGHFPLVYETLTMANFCNRAALEFLLDRLPASARQKSHLIYHGVDVDKFTPTPLPEQTKPLKIISVGRLTPTKGFDKLVIACAKAVQAGLDVELTVLGYGAQFGHLQRVAQEHEIFSRLHMPGWVSHDEVRQRIQESHLFALLAEPSYHDGLPNVVLESMATGRPVILSPLPAAPEAVTDGVEGFVLNAQDDYDGFIAALRTFIDEPDRLHSMGQAATARAVRDHDAQAQIRRLAKLLDPQYSLPAGG